ncbi:MAG: amidohydrolase family protein [Planctomycetota bacterium]|jgi:imidazolonepropionase-like amidohydrolase
MSTKISIHTICLSVCLLLPVTALAAPRKDPKSIDNLPAAVAFINVNVVPMDNERIVPGQTVIVRGDRISEVGPVDTTEIPEGALRIDGSGKYLMPALADMHVHFNYQDMAILFLANGVTTVRHMSGGDGVLTVRNKIQKGEIIGPTIHTAGPFIESTPSPGSEVVETPDQADRVVAEHKKAGYDFIKIVDAMLSAECFDAIIEAAAKHEMPVVGHVPVAVDLEHALASGMHTIEHVTGYGKFLQIQGCPDWVKLNEGKISHIAKATSRAGVWNCPTIVEEDRGMMNKKDAQQELRRPYMKYVPASMKQKWFETSPEDPNRAAKVANMKRMVKALHDAGAGILLGADAGTRYVVPGFSIHEELQNFVDVGLSPYEAIRTGTHDAAECLGQLDEFGVVRTGLRADLILVKGNPLEDVSHIKNKVGVMVRGHWLPEQELQRMLDRVEAFYSRSPENRFANVPITKTRGEKIFSGMYEFVGSYATGAERITVTKVPDGKNIVYAQLVLDPPFRFFVSMELIFDEGGKCDSLGCTTETSTGKDSVKMRRNGSSLTVSGRLASGKEINITETIAEDALLGTDIAGSLMPLIQVAKSLKVGQTREVKSRTLKVSDFSVFEKTITVKRAADGTRQTPAGVIPIQIYNVDAKSKASPYEVVITLDREGHLLEYERESEMGALKFMRTE